MGNFHWYDVYEEQQWKCLQWWSLSIIFFLISPFSKFSSVTMYTFIMKKNNDFFLNGFAGMKPKCIDRYSWVTWRKVKCDLEWFLQSEPGKAVLGKIPRSKTKTSRLKTLPCWFVNNLWRTCRKVSGEGDEELSLYQWQTRYLG